MSCISCNCGKKYQRLVCPPRSKATIDYILEWIEDASKLLEAYGIDLMQIEVLKKDLIELGVNELPNLIKDVAALKLIIDPVGEVDLTPLIPIFNSFQYDEDHNIIAASFPLIEGDLEGTDVIVLSNSNNTLKKGLSFTGGSQDYLSGDGTWHTLPEIPDFYEDITYNELYARKEDGELIPGNWYRITDYNTYILSSKAISAEHPYMVLVRATKEDELQEDAIAIRKDTDVYFTPNSHLNAWRIKYCIENDTSRFAYVNDYKPLLMLDDTTHSIYIRDEEHDMDTPESIRINESSNDPSLYAYSGGNVVGDRVYAWVKIDSDNFENIIQQIQKYHTISTTDEYIYTVNEEPTPTSILYDENGNPIINISPLRLYRKSKGMVYWMQDDRMNEAWYDFKNIQYLTDNGNIYTFSMLYDDSYIDITEIKDLHVHNNKLYPLYVDWIAENNQHYQRLELNNCYVVGSEIFNNLYGPNTYSFIIETYGKVANNHWLGNSSNNKILKGSYAGLTYPSGYTVNIEGNIFGSEFTDNTFVGYNIIDTVFNRDFTNNTFEVPEEAVLLSTTVLPNISKTTFGENIKDNFISIGVIEKSTIKAGFRGNSVKAVLTTQRSEGIDYANVLLTDAGHIISGAEVGYNCIFNIVNSLTRCIVGNDSNNNKFGAGNIDTNFGFCMERCVFEDGVQKSIFMGNTKNIVSKGKIVGCQFEQGTEYIDLISNGEYKNLNISASVSGLPTNHRKLDNSAYLPHAGKRIYVITGAEVEIQAPALVQNPSSY